MTSFLINPYRFGAAAGDPYFGNVSLLLHGDASPLVDSSGTPKTITAFGNAAYSTAQAKFGSGSIAFDGSGDYISAAASTAFDLLGSAFTIELWVRLAATQTDSGLVSHYNTVGTGWLLRTTSTGVRFYTLAALADRTFSFNTGQWYHIAVSSSSTTGTIYIDGQAQGATFATNGTESTSTTIQVGRTHTITDDLNGYIDDLRITKGVARYTANFTPPTAPFPDS